VEVVVQAEQRDGRKEDDGHRGARHCSARGSQRPAGGHAPWPAGFVPLVLTAPPLREEGGWHGGRKSSVRRPAGLELPEGQRWCIYTVPWHWHGTPDVGGWPVAACPASEVARVQNWLVVLWPTVHCSLHLWMDVVLPPQPGRSVRRFGF
jgi:hypothetical protein